MRPNTLIARLLILNLAGSAFVVYTALTGQLQATITSDATHIVFVQIGFFLVALTSIFLRALEVHRRYHEAPTDGMSKKVFLEQQEMVFSASEWLVILGLIGTVIGLSQTMSGIDLKQLLTASGAQDVISKLLGHMSIAFSTTIVGGILGLWISINFRTLRTSTIVMLEDEF